MLVYRDSFRLSPSRHWPTALTSPLLAKTKATRRKMTYWLILCDTREQDKK